MSAVHAGYRHLTKEITPAPGIELGGSALKWYDIAAGDERVPGPIRALGRGTLRGAVDSGAIELEDDLGFVILHRCGRSFYFLLVSTWRNDNELWETVWAKTDDAEGFHPWPLEGSHRPTSASGSSAPSGTSSRRGAASCVRNATRKPGTRI